MSIPLSSLNNSIVMSDDIGRLNPNLPNIPGTGEGEVPSGSVSSSYKATHIRQMYSWADNELNQQMTYNIGTQSSIVPVYYKIRNDTVSTKLGVKFISPPFLIVASPSSSHGPTVPVTHPGGPIPILPPPEQFLPGTPITGTIELAPLEEFLIKCSFKEDWSGLNLQQDISDVIIVNQPPVNISTISLNDSGNPIPTTDLLNVKVTDVLTQKGLLPPKTVDSDPTSTLAIDKIINTSEMKQILSALIVDVTPLNISGPVYVYNNLPPLEVFPAPPPIDEAPTGSIPPEPPIDNVPTPVVLTHLYISFDPTPPIRMNHISFPRTDVSNTTNVSINVFAGDASVSPTSITAKRLLFNPDSIVWEVNNKMFTTISINSLGGGTEAIFKGLTVGSVPFKAKIVKKPNNITSDEWKLLYNSINAISGNANAKRVTITNPQSFGDRIRGIPATTTPTIELTGTAFVI